LFRNTCSETLFQTPFFADFIFRNANDKNLVEGITEGSVVGTEEKQQER